MKTIFQFALVIVICWGCNSKGLVQTNAWKVFVDQSNGTIKLEQNGQEKPVTIADGNKPGFYFITNDADSLQHFSELETIEQSGDNEITATYVTSDKRFGKVVIGSDANGFVSMKITVIPTEDVKRKGIIIKSNADEHYYGLLERTVDGPQGLSWKPSITQALDLRGQKVEMAVKHTLGIYTPFYVSTHGYGVLVHGTWPGHYDMAATDPGNIRFAFEGGQLELSFITGPTVLDATKHATKVTGTTILPPKWVFNTFRWRDEHAQKPVFYDSTKNISPYNADLVEDVLMLQAYDIPCSVMWLDRPWGPGRRGYDNVAWDDQRFPNHKAMINWLGKKGEKLALWIAPWAMGKKMLGEAEANGYLIPHTEWEDSSVLIDLTNPAAVSWWQQQYLKPLLEEGVAGFKMDRSEERFYDHQETVLYNKKTVRQMRNDYPVLYGKAANEIATEVRPDDFVLFPRASYTGGQKYTTFWGGDIRPGQWGLRTALIAVQRCAFMGFPIWGSDTGGYGSSPLLRENVARWLAFSCFTPIMEVRPLHNRAPWDMPTVPSYDTTLIATYRLYAKIHEKLMDYSYKMAQQAHEDGTPIVRPLAMMHPDDEKCINHWDEFYYGDDLLVGVPWQEGKKQFDMYLPEGNWKDAWSGKEYEGSTEVTVDCPMYKSPIFIRQGSSVDLGDLAALYRESFEIASKKPDLMALQKAEFK